jgi:hypothetical protein
LCGSLFVGDEIELSKSFISNCFPFTNIFSGTGESVQDIGPISQPLPIQLDQSGRVVGSVRGLVGNAWIQVEATQNQDSLDVFKTSKKY